MNIIFENGVCESKSEVLQLGPKKILNVKHLNFEDEKMEELDVVLVRIQIYAKRKKCAEIWIPSDRETPADPILEKLGFKYGELQATIPGNSPTGWTLKL